MVELNDLVGRIEGAASLDLNMSRALHGECVFAHVAPPDVGKFGVPHGVDAIGPGNLNVLELCPGFENEDGLLMFALTAVTEHTLSIEAFAGFDDDGVVDDSFALRRRKFRGLRPDCQCWLDVPAPSDRARDS